MAYLHSKHVIHRDLKSANLLIDATGRLAVSDFGLARVSLAAQACLTAETGSYRWMAPEVMRHEPYGPSADVYSFAIVAWEMLTYLVPFQELSPVQAAFAVADQAHRPKLPAHCSTPIAELISACWEQKASKRPTFDCVCILLEELADAVSSTDALAVGARSVPPARPDRPRSPGLC